MEKIRHVEKQTDNPYLNMYKLAAVDKTGREFPYLVASRSKSIEDLKLTTGENSPDGMIIYSVYGEAKDQVVLVRQYRYSINDYIYEFPAGLVEPGEDPNLAAIRELREETGLTLSPIDADPMYTKPFFTTVGMTDESCGTIYGYASGNPSLKENEDAEDIQVVLADRKEAARILKEEKVAIKCAYMLMHFIHTQGDPLDFIKK